LGSGVAQAGTSGNTLVTDRSTTIPEYFIGHWVGIFDGSGLHKGPWRIAAIDGATLILAPNDSETIVLDEGDRWRGVYLFDKITVRGNANVVLLDDLRGQVILESGGSLTINDPPVFDPAKLTQIIVESRPDGDYVVGPAGAVTDNHPPIVLKATNGRTTQVFTANAAADGSFRVPVTGNVGDTFTLRATDSFSLPATSYAIPVNGAISETSGVASVTITPSMLTGGDSATGSVRLLHAARGAGLTVTLSSSSSAAAVPATLLVPAGAVSAMFPISTNSVSGDTEVTISATGGVSAASATLTLLAGSSALTQITLDSSAVEGGTSLNATLVLGAPAPAGGALVMLSTSNTRLAIVPQTVVIPEGTMSTAVTVSTYGVGAEASVTITATYGATVSASATLLPCSELSAAAQPDSLEIGQMWLDDALPAGASQSGDAVIDSTQSASGTSSVHLSGFGEGVRTFAFTGATPLTVTPNDMLVLHMLVNPCNAPRQIMVGWSTGTAEYRSAWGESRLDVTTPHANRGPLPGKGEWARVEVLARAIGITATANLTDLTIRAVDGEAWIDAIGARACSLATAPAPPLNPHESVWFDDELPPGAVPAPAGGATTAWTWSEAQSASGTRSHVEPLRSGLHQHYFTSATPVAVALGDLHYAYVLLDPCNPPRQVMLQWHDGAGWEHRAYWGENLINSGTNGTASRYAAGPLPATGEWVRLEVPAAMVGLEGAKISGAAFTLFDGQAWFDRSGTISRVNVALGKSAAQSSDYQDLETSVAAMANDGDLTTLNITGSNGQAWWEVDLGAVYPIESVTIHNRTDCCADRLSNFWVLVSDEPFVSTTLSTARSAPGVAALRHYSWQANRSMFTVNRTGRYVRVQLEGTNYLHMREVEVWAPATATRSNVAIGTKASQSSTYAAQYGAEQAVNGETNRLFTHTNATALPWFQLDLGTVDQISSVTISNRPDCCQDRLANFYLLVSDVELAANDLPTLLSQPGVSAFFYPRAPMIFDLPVDRSGRYVRLQLTGTNYLNIGEVQVWGQQPTLSPLSRPAAPESCLASEDEPAPPEPPVQEAIPPNRP
jgi:hypothetical protein